MTASPPHAYVASRDSYVHMLRTHMHALLTLESVVRAKVTCYTIARTIWHTRICMHFKSFL